MAAGLPLPELQGGQLQLFHLGEEVPLFVSSEENLAAGDFLYFYGEQNRTQLDGLLNPLREQLKEFERKVHDTYDQESRDRVGLHNEILRLKELNQRISEDAVNLTRALKGESKTQGIWGEMILEQLLERSFGGAK